MTRQEQIEQAAWNYGHNNPNSHWNADAEYEVDYDIPAEDFKAGALWSDANPDLYSVTCKAVEREREYLINKACEWLKDNHEEIYLRYIRGYNSYDEIEQFKKYMEEQ